MTVGEIIKMLKASEQYLIDRATVSDMMIEMIRTLRPDDYEEIREKEEHYLYVVQWLDMEMNRQEEKK